MPSHDIVVCVVMAMTMIDGVDVVLPRYERAAAIANGAAVDADGGGDVEAEAVEDGGDDQVVAAEAGDDGEAAAWRPEKKGRSC